ncbi:hypothetical protein SAMN05414139_02908 [Burkholderia sp. D7]|nr:hypothetical protein SAMN05414139_02908 [Burkholderia sp. D7]
MPRAVRVLFAAAVIAALAASPSGREGPTIGDRSGVAQLASC